MSKRVHEYPLIFNPTKGSVYVFRHASEDQWSISTVQEPIHLYQPDVQPSPEGGIVINTIPPKEQNTNTRKKYDLNRDGKKSNPFDMPWIMTNGPKQMFELTATSLTNKIPMVISFQENRMEILPVTRSLILRKRVDPDTTTAEDAERKLEERRRARMDSLGQASKKLMENVKEYGKEIEERLKSERESAFYDDQFIAGNEDDDDDDKDYLRDKHSEREEQEPDEVSEFSDDEEKVVEDEDDFLLEMSEPENEEEESSEEEEKKEDKGKEEAKAPKTGSSEEAFKEMVGPEKVKEEELVRFLMDRGMATVKEFTSRFSEKLKTQDQKDAFKKLVRKRCTWEKKGDKTVYKLKKKGKHN